MKMWWHVGVETEMGWPHVQTVVRFAGRFFILHPRSEAESATISVAYDERPYPDVGGDPLGEPRCRNQDEALQLVERFMSALAWVTDHGLTTHNEQGAGHFYAVPKRGSPHCVWPGRTFDYLPEPPTEEGRLALAYYREGLSVNSVPYQFLGFAKVLNLRLKGDQFAPWVNAHLDDVTEAVPKVRLAALKKSVPDIGDYLYVQGRCAIAHALGEPRVDPDNPADIERLRNALPLMQALARMFIEVELGVNTPGKDSAEREAKFWAKLRRPTPPAGTSVSERE